MIAANCHTRQPSSVLLQPGELLLTRNSNQGCLFGGSVLYCLLCLMPWLYNEAGEVGVDDRRPAACRAGPAGTVALASLPGGRSASAAPFVLLLCTWTLTPSSHQRVSPFHSMLLPAAELWPRL